MPALDFLAWGNPLLEIIVTASVGVLIWLILIALAMIMPRFAFAFFYWSVRLFFCVVLPSAILIGFIGLQTMKGDLGDSIGPFWGFLSLPLYLVALFIKTKIIYSRFKIVSQDIDGRQMLPGQ